MQYSLHDDEAIKGAVRQNYGSVARAGLSSEHAGMRSIAQAFGYTAEELAAIPAASNMGLSCGNPVALASIFSISFALIIAVHAGVSWADRHVRARTLRQLRPTAIEPHDEGRRPAPSAAGRCRACISRRPGSG